jgi:predicted AAA+ superfamily ATPase
MAVYKYRILDKVLGKRLKSIGAVLIEGPKWCGKTTTSEKLAQSVIYMSDPANKNQYLEMAEINPQRLLEGATPRLIDEWQLAPKIWDAVRYEVDHRDELGQFILTGSSVPPSDKEIYHTGTGRFSWLLMRPMSLFESQESSGEVSLEDLFKTPVEISGKNNLSIEKLAFLVCRGGWPRATNIEDEEAALEQAYSYYEAVVRSDISSADGVNRDTERARKLMRSYARHQGTQATRQVIINDIILNDNDKIDLSTIHSYLNALRKIFVIEDMEAWSPNLRSKTAIRTSETRYFIDPSIAVAALGIGPNDLLSDLNTFGLLFETLCVRDLRVFADYLNGKVYHYRDKNGLECDAVVHLRNGSYGLVEIKLGGDRLIEEAVANLKKLESILDSDKMKKPAFLMVLTGVGEYAYRRKDGIYIVPVGCLKN